MEEGDVEEDALPLDPSIQFLHAPSYLSRNSSSSSSNLASPTLSINSTSSRNLASPSLSINSTSSSFIHRFGGPDVEERVSGRWISILNLPWPMRRSRTVASGDLESSLLENSLDKSMSVNGYIISARQLRVIWGDDIRYWKWKQDKDSRFSEVAVLKDVSWLEINGEIDSSLLSPGKTYVAYLIYKLKQGAYGLSKPSHQKASIELNGVKREMTIHLDSTSIETHPEGNGWNQVMLGQFYNEVGV